MYIINKETNRIEKIESTTFKPLCTLVVELWFKSTVLQGNPYVALTNAEESSK
jgi:hypothetical protein